MKLVVVVVAGFVILMNLMAWVLVSRDQPKFNDGLYQFAQSSGNVLKSK